MKKIKIQSDVHIFESLNEFNQYNTSNTLYFPTAGRYTLHAIVTSNKPSHTDCQTEGISMRSSQCQNLKFDDEAYPIVGPVRGCLFDNMDSKSFPAGVIRDTCDELSNPPIGKSGNSRKTRSNFSLCIVGIDRPRLIVECGI